MKLYTCENCYQSLYFENTKCLYCGHVVGFDSDQLLLVTLTSTDRFNFFDITNCQAAYRFCQNSIYGTCNWLVPVDKKGPYCIACELNRTIPCLSNPGNLERWHRIEVAKHRLVYSLLRLNLPIQDSKGNGENKLVFDFLEDVLPDKKVITGHDSGTITLNIQEADEAERVRNKLHLGEKYRTLLGHFRHEIGHYYWDVLIQNRPDYLYKFRELFGDEGKDYASSLKAYYDNGVFDNWSDFFISPYASSHPWEDWAESWSHYLHMMDTLETAYNFGVGIHPRKFICTHDEDTVISRDPYTIKDFKSIIETWYPLTFAVNSLNRSMGHADFYPFVISPVVVKKLEFIHDVLHA